MRPAVVIASITLITVCSMGALWLSQQASNRSVRASAKLADVSLRLNGKFGQSYDGEIVAARSGFFERNGIHLALKPGGAEADPIVLVSNGTDTFGVSRSDEFLIARFKGAPIVAFAAGYLESPVVFYTLEKNGIHTPLDFIGKRVVRQDGQYTALIYDALLANLGISRGQVREISGIKDNDIAALINGKVDIWPGHVGRESYVLQQKSIAYSIIRPTDFGIHVPGTVYFTSEKIIREHPSLVQNFLNAVIAGWNLTYADYAKSVPLISTYSGTALPSEKVLYELKSQRDIVLPFGRRFTEFDDTQWKQLRNILINERMIDDSIDMSKAVTYGFLREAYRKPISFGK